MGKVKLKRKLFSENLLKFTFYILKNSLPTVSRFDKDVKSELSNLPEGFKISLIFEPSNFGITFINNKSRLKRKSFDHRADLIIYFKELKSSLKMMFGFLRLDYAFSENRLKLKGDIQKGMIFTRVLEYLLTYLYPEFLAKRSVKKIPKIRFLKKIFLRAYIYFLSIPFGL